MYYAIYCEDLADSFEKRRSVRPAHLKRLQELEMEGRLLLAGPLLINDNENIMLAGFKGSLIIAQFDSLESAKVWAAADPYVTAGVYGRVIVSPFKKVLPNNDE